MVYAAHYTSRANALRKAEVRLARILKRIGHAEVSSGGIVLADHGLHPPRAEKFAIIPWMLSLKSSSPERWLEQVDCNLADILIDHAHCEKKAAGTALNLLFAYVENEQLCREMTVIVNEELEHFHLVLDLLQRRGIPFRRLKPSTYGRQLNDLVARGEPQRAVDRLLVAGLIEARSCERFALLRDHLEDRELAEFYGGLFESEARHHSVYVRLAKSFVDPELVEQRLEELATAEAQIIETGEPQARMHS